MKQILQNINNGRTRLVDVPCPQPGKGQALIKTSRTLVSAGTERMLRDFGKAGLIEKARQQPDKVKAVFEKIKTDGLMPTINAVRAKLDQPLPLGYCNVGTVIEAGDVGFEIGNRVVSNAAHAEVVRVSKNLCARIPDNVDDDSAAFTVLSSIALQGVRLVAPSIGENVVVIGLGMIGLITVQILRANGCSVLGIDFDSGKCELAREFGAETVDLSKGEDSAVKVKTYSRGYGADAVIITASTKSNEPVSQAAGMCRQRGRIVLVGVAGLTLSRADFYEKELTFQVSCSYGPGRYDVEYEEKGTDYPIGFVRWTEQRNFEAVLDLMASGQLDVKPLISQRFSIENAAEAYRMLDDSSTIGILLEYSGVSQETLLQNVVALAPERSYPKGDVVCGFLGAGNYASRVLIPAFARAGARMDTLATGGGVSAVHHGKKNGFVKAATGIDEVLACDDINTVIIATQHDLHSGQVVESLQAGKNVFVEKPLALTNTDLDQIDAVYRAQEFPARIMIGFNRRFSPHIIQMKKLLERVSQPKSFIMTMNAGAIPADHWVQNPDTGGGRIIGEACHYIDLMRFLAGSKIKDFSVALMGPAPGVEVREDKASITLTFEDGSFGTIHYFANGGQAFPKERVEVFCEDAVLQLDNFRKLTGFGWKGFKKHLLISQDKGQKACVKAFVDAIRKGKPAPIDFEEIMEVSRITIQVAEALYNK